MALDSPERFSPTVAWLNESAARRLASKPQALERIL
jgi:hypothetical protein